MNMISTGSYMMCISFNHLKWSNIHSVIIQVHETVYNSQVDFAVKFCTTRSTQPCTPGSLSSISLDGAEAKMTHLPGGS